MESIGGMSDSFDKTLERFAILSDSRNYLSYGLGQAVCVLIYRLYQYARIAHGINTELRIGELNGELNKLQYLYC